MAIKARRKVINTQMKNKTKVIKVPIFYKIYECLKPNNLGEFEEIRYLVHISIISDVRDCIFVNKIKTDLLKRLK